MEGAFVFVPKKGKSPFGQDWFAMAQDAMMFMAKNRRVLGEEGFAVFCALGSRLDFENFILVSQADLARDLGMLPQNIGRAVKRLEGLGVLTRGPKSGRSPTFRLNPKMAWKGGQKNHFSALQEAERKGWHLVEGGQADPDQPGLPFDV